MSVKQSGCLRQLDIQTLTASTPSSQLLCSLGCAQGFFADALALSAATQQLDPELANAGAIAVWKDFADQAS